MGIVRKVFHEIGAVKQIVCDKCNKYKFKDELTKCKKCGCNFCDWHGKDKICETCIIKK